VRVLVRLSVETPTFSRWLGVYLDAPGPPSFPVRFKWPGAYSDAPGAVLVGLFCIIWPGVLLVVVVFCAQAELPPISSAAAVVTRILKCMIWFSCT